jgi:hypothetical protein
MALLAVAASAILLRLAAWVAFPNILWPDEVFQSLEPAHRAVFGYGIIPWEFRVGTRSWILPGAIAGVMRAASVFSSGTGYLALIAAALTFLSLAPVVSAFVIARRDHGVGPAVVAAVACAGWFELVFFAPKALTEVAAGNLLVPALALLPAPQGAVSPRRSAAAGVLLGLVVALRIQLAPAVLVAAAWACRREARARWRPLIGGMVPVLLAAGLLDAFTWSYAFHSYARSIWVNLVEGRSRMYGVQSPDAYLRMIAAVWSWALVPLLALAAVGTRRRPGMLVAAVAVFATHSVLAHKEYRFVYPAIVLVVVLAALGTGDLIASVRDRARARWIAGVTMAAAVAAWTGTSMARATGFRSDDVMIGLGPRGGLWRRQASAVEAFELFRDDPGVCGIGLAGIPWYLTPGYATLHRNVAIREASTAAELAAALPYVNAVLAAPGVTPGPPTRRVHCWADGVCLFSRPGRCAADAGYDLNDRIRKRGE